MHSSIFYRLVFALLLFLVSGNQSLLGQSERNLAVAQAQPNEQRVALVIGNADYKATALRNPVNDATDMAQALRELGFSVTLRTNASQRQMKQAARAFGAALKHGGVGLFYFAGHGVQSRGRNYLVPIGASIDSEADLEDESVDANFVLALMEEAGNRVNIVVLDACRNNPFARNFRSAAGGLAQMEPSKGTFVAFATAPGSVAADGTGRNGLYTERLLSSLKHPDGDIDKVFRRVAADVSTITNGKQVPWVASSLTGDFYFRASVATLADDTKLRQAEKERVELTKALEEERKKRDKDAEALRQEMEKLRAELQSIRMASLATQPAAPSVTPGFDTTTTTSRPTGSQSGQQPQVAVGSPPPNPPASLSPAFAAVESGTESTASKPTGGPAEERPQVAIVSPPPRLPASSSPASAAIESRTSSTTSKPMESPPEERPQVAIVSLPPSQPASVLPPSVTAGSTTPGTGPQPIESPEQRPQVAMVSPSPSPTVTTLSDPSAEWAPRLALLGRLHGQLTFSKAVAVLLDASSEKDLTQLLEQEATLKRLGWQSAYAMGIDRNGWFSTARSWKWYTQVQAADRALEGCNRRADGDTCRVVMVNGEFQEREFLEVAKRFGAQNVATVRQAYLQEITPRDSQRAAPAPAYFDAETPVNEIAVANALIGKWGGEIYFQGDRWGSHRTLLIESVRLEGRNWKVAARYGAGSGARKEDEYPVDAALESIGGGLALKFMTGAGSQVELILTRDKQLVGRFRTKGGTERRFELTRDGSHEAKLRLGVPSGAEVRIIGDGGVFAYPRDPIIGGLEIQLSQGAYIVEVTKPGFVRWVETINLTKEQPVVERTVVLTALETRVPKVTPTVPQ